MKGRTKMTLADLKIGESRTVISVSGEERISRRLMEMGVIPGVSVRMVKAAPFGDPLEIKVRGYSLALRRNEAQAIEIDGGRNNE
jgi:Fe2+ transport system protein FeoA